MYFFKEKGMDLRSKDSRGSTPLHWVCYSKSEIALCYLLSWVKYLDDPDIEGYTALHLAVKSVETLKSTRPVRSLLIRGASREARDKNDRRPIDLLDQITSPQLQNELKSMLKNPRVCSCFMIKTPLKLMKKSVTTPLFFLFMIMLSYILMLLLVFPCKLIAINVITIPYSLPVNLLVHHRHHHALALRDVLLHQRLQRPRVPVET
ncbi:MAG: ankyrin repeat domain-containing protein [Candidatus Roizmanbacteria bacterium]